MLLCTLLFAGVTASAQPVARFSGNNVAGCAPILVNFSDESTGNPNFWKWDLGNGTISYLQNPSVTYFIPGNYNVKLVVKNAAGQDSLIKTNYVQVHAAPMVDFIASQTSGCNTVSTIFTDRSNGSNAWQWDFGDGIFSTEQNPSHVYTQTGSYNVSLKAINGEGCALTLVKQAYINVNIATANFAYSVANRCLPTRVNFQNNSDGNGRLVYKWQFGTGDTSSLQNTVYTYPSGGTYRAKLTVSNEFGCEDTFSTSITVANPVSATFTANTTASCKAPAAIQFTNQSLANNNYTWSFGDTTFSSASSPMHIFNDTGSFTVKLVVRNNNGCTDSLTKINYINIIKPFVAFDNLPDSGCTGFNKHISVSSAGTDSITNYLWNFGDGGTSTISDPSHIFSGERYFTISLITTGASGCRDTAVLENAVRTGFKPVADFSSDVQIACSQTQINFIDQTQGSVTQWQWNFGDNAQEFQQNPQHRFSDTGYLAAELITLNGGCADTATKLRYVYIKPSVSKFKLDFNCQNPSQFLFTNLAIGADSWLWNFGDSTTSTELNPVHVYSDTGTYTVSLITHNTATGCDGYKAKGVITTKAVPVFFASDSVICKEGEVTFTSTLASSDVSRFFWYFGDGSFESTLENRVTHQYEQPGMYSIKLVTLNLANCRDSIIKTNYISVKEVKANFGIPVPVVCSGTQVQFTDSSQVNPGSSIQSWQWNYGDGHTDTLTAPPFIHSYAARGSYAVGVKVTDNNGCSDTYTSGVPLTVKKIYPQFWINDTIKCTNSNVSFICPFAEAGIAYHWDFGDSTNAAVQSPRHQYAREGIYTIKLRVSAQQGCVDSFELVNKLKIVDPVAKFSISDSFRNCPPLIVQFTNESINAVDEVWDFGDGTSINAHNPSHFYSYPGVYTASLTVKGAGGCTNTTYRKIIVQGPKGSFRYGPLNFCQAPAGVTFTALTTDASSFVWDFNDGATVSNNDSVITHLYNDAGQFVPKLMLVDNEGCRVPVQGIDTIKFANVTAQFQLPDTSVCSDKNILFTNTSSSADSIINYRWNFGDGTITDNIINALHNYPSEGIYYPTLTVRTISGCADTFTTAVPVRVALSPDVLINASSTSGCMPFAVSFNGVMNSVVVPVTHWQWDFSNGNVSTAQNPAAQTYAIANSYAVQLTATGSNGCKRIITKNIMVNPLPAIQVTGNRDICRGNSTTLTANGAGSLQWFSADVTMSCSNCTSTILSPQATTDYIIKGTNDFGCIAADTITVKVAQPFSINYNSTAKVCAGLPTTLQVSGAEVYEWYPSTGLSNAASSSPLAQPAATTTYKVIAKNANGCFSDSGFITVNVNAVPTVDAGEDKIINAGTSTELIPVVSQDVSQVIWSPTGDIFRNADNAITVKPTITTEYIATAKNAAGCMATDKIKVTVNNQDPTAGIFVPNTFSPNGDGANDIFYPRAAGSVKINRLRILNREGVIVFEKANFYTNDIAAGWDGTLRGSKLAIDVYVYGIEITGTDGKPKVISGNVSLIR